MKEKRLSQKDFMLFLKSLRSENNPKISYNYPWLNAKRRNE